MQELAVLLPAIIKNVGSLAQLALVIVFVYVFRKGTNNQGDKGIQDAVELLGSNHITHLNEKIDKLVTDSAVQTEILRDIRDNLRK